MIKIDKNKTDIIIKYNKKDIEFTEWLINKCFKITDQGLINFLSWNKMTLGSHEHINLHESILSSFLTKLT